MWIFTFSAERISDGYARTKVPNTAMVTMKGLHANVKLMQQT